MTVMETWELLRYVGTVIGVPRAISIFIYEQNQERNNEEEVYQLRSDSYHDDLRLVIENPDLKL